MILSELYPITPSTIRSVAALLRLFAHYKNTLGAEMVQLRLRACALTDYRRLAERAVVMAHELGLKILLNAQVDWANSLGADGVHLTSKQLLQWQGKRPAGVSLLGASCHTLAQCQQAVLHGLDFVTLSPIQATHSHPGQTPLGWDMLKACCHALPIKVFALGGVGPKDLQKAQACGAYGVAGIRAFSACKIVRP